MSSEPPPDAGRPPEGAPPQESEFERLAAREPAPGFASDVWFFLKENKKWWLAPMLLVLLLLGGLVVLSGTAAAPFIYTLF